MMATF